MSYGVAASLQSAVYQRLRADPDIQALLGTAVFDAMPVGTPPDTYISLGPEEVRDRSDKLSAGALHRFTVSVITNKAGFSEAKRIAAHVGDALIDADLSLDRGRLVGLWFERAAARRTGRAARLRRVDLRFAARVEDNEQP